jgi:hypothetical protein
MDVAPFTILLYGQYPSVYHQGANAFRGGCKSDAYKQLFGDVVSAARAEMERTEWETATAGCALTVVRYWDRSRHAASVSVEAG